MRPYQGLYIAHGNKKWYHENENSSCLRTEPLTTTVIENGIILPAKADPSRVWALGGVLRNDLSFVVESATREIFGGAYDFSSQDVTVSEQTVIFFGPFLCHWGHFLCDEISRLWYVLPDIENCLIAYCGWNWGNPQTALWGNFLEFMHLLGLKDHQLIDIQTPTRFKKIIIPELSFLKGTYYTNAFLDIFWTVTQNVAEADYKFHPKVYFSRRSFSEALKKERGEEVIEAFFSENGYQILFPETLSLRDQISIYQNASEIAALSGSITHSLLFAHPDLIVTIINKTNAINTFQMLIDNMSNISICYVDGYMRRWPVCYGYGPFWLGINSYIRKFARDRSMKLPNHRQIQDSSRSENQKWYLSQYWWTYADKQRRIALFKELKSRITRKTLHISERH